MNIKAVVVSLIGIMFVLTGCTQDTGWITTPTVSKTEASSAPSLKSVPDKNSNTMRLKKITVRGEFFLNVTLDLTAPSDPTAPDAIDWTTGQWTVFDNDAAISLYPEVIVELEKNGYTEESSTIRQNTGVFVTGNVLVRPLKKDAYDTQGVKLPGAVARFSYSTLYSGESVALSHTWQYHSNEDMSTLLQSLEGDMGMLDTFSLTNHVENHNLPVQWAFQYNGNASPTAEVDITANGALLYRDLTAQVNGRAETIIWNDTASGEKEGHVSVLLTQGNISTLSIDGMPLEKGEDGVLEITKLELSDGSVYPQGLESTWNILTGGQDTTAIPLIITTTAVSDIGTIRKNARTAVDNLNIVYSKTNKRFRLANVLTFTTEDFITTFNAFDLLWGEVSPVVEEMFRTSQPPDLFSDYFWQFGTHVPQQKPSVPSISMFSVDKDAFKAATKGEELHVAGYSTAWNTVDYDGKAIRKPFVVIAPLEKRFDPFLDPRYIGIPSHELGHQMGLDDANSYAIIDTTGVAPDFGKYDPMNVSEWKTDPMGAVGHLPASDIHLSAVHINLVSQTPITRFNQEDQMLIDTPEIAKQTRLKVVDIHNTPLIGAQVKLYCMHKAFKKCSTQTIINEQTFDCVPSHPQPIAVLTSGSDGTVLFDSPTVYFKSKEDTSNLCATIAVKIDYEGTKMNTIISGLDSIYASVVDNKTTYDTSVVVSNIR